MWPAAVSDQGCDNAKPFLSSFSHIRTFTLCLLPTLKDLIYVRPIDNQVIGKGAPMRPAVYYGEDFAPAIKTTGWGDSINSPCQTW